ncbi:MAG TPA: hypothetical protein QF694_08270, partial [Dehalococcoidia bacterium]|nr:hypothetical protein [Dehalococcoidia bacterium]
ARERLGISDLLWIPSTIQHSDRSDIRSGGISVADVGIMRSQHIDLLPHQKSLHSAVTTVGTRYRSDIHATYGTSRNYLLLLGEIVPNNSAS